MKGDKKLTIVTAADIMAVDYSFPDEQVIAIDGTEALDSLLLLPLHLPLVEFLDESLSRASGA